MPPLAAVKDVDVLGDLNDQVKWQIYFDERSAPCFIGK